MTKPTYKKVKAVTRPTLKKVDGEAVVITIDGKIFTGSDVKASKGEAKMEPARIVNVIDHLDNNKEKQMIVNAVLESILSENYEKDTYVGKAFEIIQYQPEGKRYKNYEVTEVQVS